MGSVFYWNDQELKHKHTLEVLLQEHTIKLYTAGENLGEIKKWHQKVMSKLKDDTRNWCQKFKMTSKSGVMVKIAPKEVKIME